MACLLVGVGLALFFGSFLGYLDSDCKEDSIPWAILATIAMVIIFFAVVYPGGNGVAQKSDTVIIRKAVLEDGTVVDVKDCSDIGGRTVCKKIKDGYEIVVSDFLEDNDNSYKGNTSNKSDSTSSGLSDEDISKIAEEVAKLLDKNSSQ